MAKNQVGNTLDRQINDYLLAASGHLKEDKAGIDVRRVAAYGAAAGSALVMMSQAEAAVVHNAGAPVTVTGDSMSGFDMNGDGIDDFALFGYSFSASAGLNGTPGAANNSVLGNGDVYRMSGGTSIGPTPPVGLSWQTATGTLRNVFFRMGYGASNWNGSSSETGYAGVRFKISGKTHYGWIKLTIGDSPGYLTANEWAYESCPDTPIQAGAISGGATCGPAAIPVMGLPALGLASLALGGMGLAGLRRRRQGPGKSA